MNCNYFNVLRLYKIWKNIKLNDVTREQLKSHHTIHIHRSMSTPLLPAATYTLTNWSPLPLTQSNTHDHAYEHLCTQHHPGPENWMLALYV